MFEILIGRIASDIWANTRLNLVKDLDIENKKILDLGCGLGYIGKSLQKKNKVVFGDKDESVKKLKDGIILDATHLPFKSSEFDCVICGDVLEHIEDDELALKNIYKVLKRRGIAIITVPCFEFLYGSHDVSLGHKRRYDKKMFEKKLKKLGFKVLKSRYYSASLFLPYLLIQRMSVNKVYKGRSKLEPKIVFLLDFICKLDKMLSLPFGTGLFIVLEKV